MGNAVQGRHPDACVSDGLRRAGLLEQEHEPSRKAVPRITWPLRAIAVANYVTIDTMDQLNENADKFGGKIVGIEPSGRRQDAGSLPRDFSRDALVREWETGVRLLNRLIERVSVRSQSSAKTYRRSEQPSHAISAPSHIGMVFQFRPEIRLTSPQARLRYYIV